MIRNKTLLILLLIGCFGAPFGRVSAQPVLNWATYFGGAAHDYGRSIARDHAGNIYIAGHTESTSGISTAGAWQYLYGGGSIGAGDAFLAKFSSAGTLLWATYFGGSDAEQALCVATDTFGNVYLGGYTKSLSGVATANAFQTIHGGSNDAFLARFSSNGSLVWATYYGSAGNDQANALLVDNHQNIYMAGTTRSTSGISTPGTHQPTIATTTADDAFLVKFDTAGNRLWGTYYGGNGNDVFYSIASDGAGNIYATGWASSASSSGIATPGTHQPAYGGGTFDGILVKFNAAGQRVWGSYFGGNLVDQAQHIAVHDTAGIYISGITTSTTGISSAGAHQTVHGGQADAFLVRFDTAGQRIWSTYYGGSALDQGDVVLTDNEGQAYLCGVSASSSGIATPGIIKDTVNLRDIYIAKFTTAGTRLWGTYTGGENFDLPYGARWVNGSLFLVGNTNSVADFATAGAHQPAHGGGSSYDAFLLRIDDCPSPVAPVSVAGPAFVCAGDSVYYSCPPVAGAVFYTWQLPSGWTGSGNQNVIAAVPAHGAPDTIGVAANFICGSSTFTRLPVTVSPAAKFTTAGSLSFCAGDSLVLEADTAYVVSWQWLHNGQVLSSATDSVLTVIQPGLYQLITVSTGNCTDTSSGDSLVMYAQPQPVITQNGSTLSTGNYAGYQWYHNGIPVTGANMQTYTLIVPTGVYTVSVTDTNGCSNISPGFFLANTSIVHNETRIIYPNPVDDMLYVRKGAGSHIAIYSPDGRVLISKLLTDEALDVSELPAGIYLVALQDGPDNRVFIRLLKR